MGNNASNRRVTVVNDDVVGVVQVSENVIRRLKGVPEKSSDTAKVFESGSEKPSPAAFIPAEPYSSTLEQRKKFQEEFERAEVSWQNRINELESQNKLLFETSKDQFGVLMTEIEEKHMKNSYLPVCPDKHQEVLMCFKNNLKLPMNCSQEVTGFLDCVEKVRMTALAK